ncbi:MULTISPECIES: SRPBCC family protein [unclassified Bradyrhizobium]|uniref:SRPBCC family protein n=1 Tax=unclassified Bradyrhizobium TaxID=2631580 RepID=UPI002FEF6223
MQWFGPGSVEEGSVKADINLRVGGRYRISFNANGTYNEVGGVYREVVPNQRLVFSWAWHSTPERESLVTLTLKPDGAGTLLTFHHAQFADATARDNHERGWMELLAKLESYLA